VTVTRASAGSVGAYIPQLDGLRAVAVVAVVAYHVSDWHAPVGGWIGVDLFFALSGFLITRIVLAEAVDRGRPSLRSFWVRRWLRLLPALVVALVVFNLVALVRTPQNYDGEALPLSNVWAWSASALLYVTNWLDLFDPSGIPQGLGHLWSLAVEEQFYLFWPVVLWVVAARSAGERTIRWALRLAVVGTLGSWALAALGAAAASSRAVYFSTPTRVGGLLAGAALGVVWVRSAPSQGWSRTPAWRVARISVVGMFGLLVLVAPVDDTFGMQLGPALVGVLCVGLVAFAVDATGPVRSLLVHPVARWVGRRSYAIYLWHEMIRAWTDDLPRVAAIIVTVGATLLAAELSYRIVERPALALKDRLARSVHPAAPV
jgi:peptidoglycan/LPS O-acetylase OafA/YrhL